MAIIRVPPIQSTESRTQIPLSIPASSGQGAAQIGRVAQAAEAQAMQSLISTIDAFGQNQAAEQEALAKNALNRATANMRQMAEQRSLQTVDEEGNPLYGSLISDVQAGMNDIISDTLGNIKDSRLRADVENRLNVAGMNIVTRLYGEQQKQKYNFIRGTSTVSVQENIDQAIAGNVDVVTAMERINQDLNETGGAYTVGEKYKILNDARKDVIFGQASTVFNSAKSSDTVAAYLGTIDESEYLTEAEKVTIAEKGNKVLTQLAEKEALTRNFEDITAKIATGSSLLGQDPKLIESHYNQTVNAIAKQKGEALSLQDKMYLALSYKGVVVKPAMDQLSKALQNPNQAPDALSAFSILRKSNPELLQYLDVNSVKIAGIASSTLSLNPEMAPSEALDTARKAFIELEPENRKRLIAAFNKESKIADVGGFTGFVEEQLDNVFTEWYDIRSVWQVSDLDPIVVRTYRDLLQLNYMLLNGDWSKAVDATDTEFTGKVGPSAISNGKIIINPPELNMYIGKDGGEDVKGILLRGVQERVPELFEEGVDVTQQSDIVFNTDTITQALSGGNDIYYNVEREVNGTTIPVMRTDEYGNRIAQVIKFSARDHAAQKEVIKDIKAIQEVNTMKKFADETGFAESERNRKEAIAIFMGLNPGDILSKDENSLQQRIRYKIREFFKGVYKATGNVATDIAKVAFGSQGGFIQRLRKKMRSFDGVVRDTHTNVEDRILEDEPLDAVDEYILTQSAKSFMGEEELRNKKVEVGPAGEMVREIPGSDYSPATYEEASVLEQGVQPTKISIYRAAQGVFKDNNVLASLATLQAILESGGDLDSTLVRTAKNLFGIKAKGGLYVELPTKEVVNGVTTNTTAKFKKYETFQGSLEDYAKLLRTNPRYKDVLEADTLEEAIIEISVSGYMTDESYAKKLSDIKRNVLDPILHQNRLKPQSFVQPSKEFLFSKDVRTMKHLNTVRTPLANKVTSILEILEKEGYYPIITDGVRTIAQQRAKVAKGYSSTMNSNHLGGNAVDIVDKRYMWTNKKETLEFWRALGRAIKKVDTDNKLGWGGRWFKRGRVANDIGWDPAHVELR